MEQNKLSICRPKIFKYLCFQGSDHDGEPCFLQEPADGSTDWGVIHTALRQDLHHMRKCFSGEELCLWIRQHWDQCQRYTGG